MAWLYAAPKQHEKDENPQSRVKTLDKTSPANALPEADPFIEKCFYLSGMFLSGGMAIMPLTWVEMAAFIKTSGYKLNGWEAEQVIMMSREYCSFSHKAQKKGCAPPFSKGIELTDIQLMRENVSKKWEGFQKELSPKGLSK